MLAQDDGNWVVFCAAVTKLAKLLLHLRQSEVTRLPPEFIHLSDHDFFFISESQLIIDCGLGVKKRLLWLLMKGRRILLAIYTNIWLHYYR